MQVYDPIRCSDVHWVGVYLVFVAFCNLGGNIRFRPAQFAHCSRHLKTP